MFDVFLAVVVVQIFVGMDVFTISMQCFSYFIFFFRGIFQNHVVDSDYSCFTASSYGYHYCVPRHQEAQASSWVRKFPCRFSCLLIAFSPRSGPLFLRLTVQYLVFFEAVLFGCHATFLWVQRYVTSQKTAAKETIQYWNHFLFRSQQDVCFR